jgi:hypothetical protein
MKKESVLFFVIFLLMTSIKLQAQDSLQLNKKRNYISIAPFGLINKYRLSYERESLRHYSLGFVISYHKGHTAVYLGPSLYLVGKLYLDRKSKKHGNNGLYAILQPGIAYTKTPYDYYVSAGYSESGGKETVYIDGRNSVGYGFGLGLGYKLSISRCFIDFNIRFQSWKMTNDKELYIENGKYKTKNELNSKYYQRYIPITEKAISSPIVGTFLLGYIF